MKKKWEWTVDFSEDNTVITGEADRASEAARLAAKGAAMMAMLLKEKKAGGQHGREYSHLSIDDLAAIARRGEGGEADDADDA